MRTTDRHRHPQKTAAVIAALALLLLAVLAVGCAESPELGEDENVYTTNDSEGRLRLMAVDQELSRQAQSGELDIDNLPDGKLSFPENRIDEAGNVSQVPWVVNSDFFFTQMDIFFAEAVTADDGSIVVVYQMHDEQGRNSSGKLKQMTAEMVNTAAETGETATIAVVYNGAIRAFVPLSAPITSGQIQIVGLSRQDVDELIFYFPDRAYRFPEEGKESKWQ